MGMHALRIDDSLWSAAMAKARNEGKTLTDVITDGLTSYTGRSEVYGITVQPHVGMPEGALVLASDSVVQVHNVATEPPAASPAQPAAPTCKHVGVGFKQRCPACGGYNLTK